MLGIHTITRAAHGSVRAGSGGFRVLAGQFEPGGRVGSGWVGSIRVGSIRVGLGPNPRVLDQPMNSSGGPLPLIWLSAHPPIHAN